MRGWKNQEKMKRIGNETTCYFIEGEYYYLYNSIGLLVPLIKGKVEKDKRMKRNMNMKP